MKWKACWTALAVVLLGAMAVGQAQEQYLDVFMVQVKPEKRADFDAISKKIAAANHQNKGDSWIAMETVYGRGDRVTFTSMRSSYADADKSTEIFNQALQKSYGKEAAEKMLHDFDQCLSNSRSEFRRRRMDLSSNAPVDAAAMAKMLGNTRFLRTTAVHVRPGQVATFEALLKDLKTAREKASPPQTVLVSQAVAGQEGTVFYITSLQNSMAGFDAIPSMPQMLGEEGYEKFLKTNAEAVEGTETVINHFLPELSNAPEDVVAAAPDYWRPKATMAKAGAAKSGENSKAEQKSKQ
jgi:hypothetical protein